MQAWSCGALERFNVFFAGALALDDAPADFEFT
jgi:hypothetical protein